jgi:hypothetical protein
MVPSGLTSTVIGRASLGDEYVRVRDSELVTAFAQFLTPDDLEAFQACQAGLRAAAGVTWSDISRGMHREHHGQPSRADDELQMRAFWRQWQRLMAREDPPDQSVSRQADGRHLRGACHD